MPGTRAEFLTAMGVHSQTLGLTLMGLQLLWGGGGGHWEGE